MVFFRQAFLNRAIFWFPFFILGILLLLSFYCHPTAEDIAIIYFNDTKGLVANIRDFYINDSSRYFSFPLLFALFNCKFIVSHYYLVPIILYGLFFASCYNFIGVVAKYSSSIPVKKIVVAWLSALLVITLFSVSFQASSIFYWISGSITYLPAFIIFLFLGAQLVKLFSNKKMSALSLVGCILCTACICGSNEISLFFLFGVLSALQFIFYRLNKRLSFGLNILIVTLGLCVIFLILPAGSGKRAHDFATTFSFSNALLSALLYTLRTIYHVASVPLAWVLMAIAWIAGHYASTGTKKIILNTGVGPGWVLFFTVLMSYLFYFTINFLSGELLPPRANNLMAFYVLIFILIAFFLTGIQCSVPLFPEEKNITTVVAGLGLIIIFFSSPIFINSIENVFTGYFYNKVMKGRETSIAKALQKGKKTVEILSYEKEYEVLIQKNGNKASKLFDKLEKYPEYIFYLDPVADTGFYIYYYAAYKNIDTIQFEGKKYPKLHTSR